MIDCNTARELLPWYLNGTLEPADAAAVEKHLEGCPGCRDELEATRAAAAVFTVHPESERLAAWAAGEVGPADEAVAVHLAGCVECREEVALAHAGLAALEDRGVTRPRRLGWLLATAAVLVVALAAAVVWLALGGGVEASRARVAALGERVGRLESEARQLQERVAAAADATAAAQQELARARQRLAQRAGARFDVRVLELLPGSLTLRGTTPSQLPAVPADRLLSLVLVRGDRRPFASFRLTARGRSGGVRWQARGLKAQPDGDVAVVLPAEQLGVGELRLELEGATAGGGWEKVGEYRMMVTGEPPGAKTNNR